MPRGDRGGHGQGPVVDEGLWLRGEESCRANLTPPARGTYSKTRA